MGVGQWPGPGPVRPGQAEGRAMVSFRKLTARTPDPRDPQPDLRPASSGLQRPPCRRTARPMPAYRPGAARSRRLISTSPPTTSASDSQIDGASASPSRAQPISTPATGEMKLNDATPPGG